MEDPRERWRELADLVLGAFEYLRLTLADLPIPVAIAKFDMDADNKAEVLMALDRARTLIDDEPIPDGRKAALDKIILDWFCAFELSALAVTAGAAPWRLDGVNYALLRFAAGAHLIESGEMDDDES